MYAHDSRNPQGCYYLSEREHARLLEKKLFLCETTGKKSTTSEEDGTKTGYVEGIANKNLL